MNYTVIHSDTEQSITRNQAAYLVDLDWIEVMSMAGDEVTYSITHHALDTYTPHGDVDVLVSVAEAAFPDVVAASALHMLGPDCEPDFGADDLTNDLLLCGCPKELVNDEGAHQEGCSMSLYNSNEVLAAILSILPDAEIGEDNEGQIVIYTGLEELANSKTSGRFVKPQPAIGPTPEGQVRIMVLDDGETYSGLANCTVQEVPGSYDGDQIEESLSQANSLTEDPYLVFVAQFNADGLAV